MNILIAYASNSGGTKDVADRIGALCASEGHRVSVMCADRVDPTAIGQSDLTIFGSCTWELITKERRFEGQLHEQFIKLREVLKGKQYPGKRFAVLGLGDTSYSHFCIAANHLEALVKQLQGIQIGPTLRIDKYFYHLDENRQRVDQWVRGIMNVTTKPTQ
jgi:flavodoxin